MSPLLILAKPRWIAAESSVFPFPVAPQSALAFHVRAQAGSERLTMRSARQVLSGYLLTQHDRSRPRQNSDHFGDPSMHRFLVVVNPIDLQQHRTSDHTYHQIKRYGGLGRFHQIAEKCSEQ